MGGAYGLLAMHAPLAREKNHSTDMDIYSVKSPKKKYGHGAFVIDLHC